MISLGIDTSNYATSLAVVDTGRMEVVCAKKKYLPVAKGQSGLRQSDAVFLHNKTLPLLFTKLKKEGVLQKIEAIAVSERPRPVNGSYMPCFLAGVNTAVAISAFANLPLFKTSHQEGHLAAALFGAGLWNHTKGQDYLFLHFSGGTTELLKISGGKVAALLGKSLDLYAGQAIDRLGVKLGFSFPAGESLSGLASQCKDTIKKPKVCLREANCHLSGLENQCEKFLQQGQTTEFVAKYCLLFIAHSALGMIAHARKTEGDLPVVCAGGVMASHIICKEMKSQETNLYFVPPALSGDNAVGVALLAETEA